MKILIINWQDIRNRFSGGAEVHLFEIFKRIATKGHNVTLLCCKLPELPSYEEIDNIKIIRIGNRDFFNFFVPRYYIKHLKKENFDIVIDDINKIPFFTPLYVDKPILCIAHHFFGKTIFKQVDIIRGLYVYVSEYLMDFIYKNYPFVVVSESTLAEFKSRGYDIRNFDIVYNALDFNKFPFEIGEKAKTPTITYFGRLKRYKSIEHLLLAFQKVLKIYPDANLYIVGGGDYENELKRLAVQLKIHENTKFWGFVNENKKIELLSISHCVVNTSIKEGWGITNLESNACGTPVISANVPGLRDSVNDGVSGLLFKYGDIDDLTSKILKILEDRDLFHKLCLGAISWARKFSWENSAEKMLEIIEKVVHNYRG
ncbi:MAG: glycosyltransferase family 4 protein [Ignavibacteria bacterium]|nr:glycosyltransferase family 4 protein [Ignavibacteria bacterium]